MENPVSAYEAVKYTYFGSKEKSSEKGIVTGMDYLIQNNVYIFQNGIVVKFLDIFAANQHFAFLHIVEPGNKFNHSAFAGTRLSPVPSPKSITRSLFAILVLCISATV